MATSGLLEQMVPSQVLLTIHTSLTTVHHNCLKVLTNQFTQAAGTSTHEYHYTWTIFIIALKCVRLYSDSY